MTREGKRQEQGRLQSLVSLEIRYFIMRIIVKLKVLTFIEHLLRAKHHVKYFTFNSHNTPKRQVLFYH